MKGAKVGASLSPLGTAASIPTILSTPCHKQLSLSLHKGGEDEQQRKRVDFVFVCTTRWNKHRNYAISKRGYNLRYCREDAWIPWEVWRVVNTKFFFLLWRLRKRSRNPFMPILSPSSWFSFFCLFGLEHLLLFLEAEAPECSGTSSGESSALLSPSFLVITLSFM